MYHTQTCISVERNKVKSIKSIDPIVNEPRVKDFILKFPNISATQLGAMIHDNLQTDLSASSIYKVKDEAISKNIKENNNKILDTCQLIRNCHVDNLVKLLVNVHGEDFTPDIQGVDIGGKFLLFCGRLLVLTMILQVNI